MANKRHIPVERKIWRIFFRWEYYVVWHFPKLFILWVWNYGDICHALVFYFLWNISITSRQIKGIQVSHVGHLSSCSCFLFVLFLSIFLCTIWQGHPSYSIINSDWSNLEYVNSDWSNITNPSVNFGHCPFPRRVQTCRLLTVVKSNSCQPSEMDSIYLHERQKSEMLMMLFMHSDFKILLFMAS